MLSDILKQLENVIPKDRFNKGNENLYLKEISNQYNITNPELLEIYLWQNGSKFSYDNNNNIEFCSFGFLLPINTAVDAYNEDYLEFKKDGLFPILSDYDGDYLLLDLNTPAQPVYITSAELFIIKPEVIFENIETMLKAVYECYQSNIYTALDSSLDVDHKLEFDIFQKHSTSFSRWMKPE